MVFESGIEAISWYFNKVESMSHPACCTAKITNMLKIGFSISGDTSVNGVEEKLIAAIDMEKILKLLEPTKLELLKEFANNGMRAAVIRVKKHADWEWWRKENIKQLNKCEITYSKKVFEVLDEWEEILIENDYMEEPLI